MKKQLDPAPQRALSYLSRTASAFGEEPNFPQPPTTKFFIQGFMQILALSKNQDWA
jgi:hypothetical protein